MSIVKGEGLGSPVEMTIHNSNRRKISKQGFVHEQRSIIDDLTNGVPRLEQYITRGPI